MTAIKVHHKHVFFIN